MSLTNCIQKVVIEVSDNINGNRNISDKNETRIKVAASYDYSKEELGIILYRKMVRKPSRIENYAKGNEDSLQSYRDMMFRLLIAREAVCFKVDKSRDLCKAAVWGSDLL